MELAPYSIAFASEQVVKASKGHIPQPFLISKLKKNWCKDKRERFETSKKIFCADAKLVYVTGFCNATHRLLRRTLRRSGSAQQLALGYQFFHCRNDFWFVFPTKEESVGIL